jgi:hypothetical protein
MLRTAWHPHHLLCKVRQSTHQQIHQMRKKSRRASNGSALQTLRMQVALAVMRRTGQKRRVPLKRTEESD